MFLNRREKSPQSPYLTPKMTPALDISVTQLSRKLRSASAVLAALSPRGRVSAMLPLFSPYQRILSRNRPGLSGRFLALEARVFQGIATNILKLLAEPLLYRNLLSSAAPCTAPYQPQTRIAMLAVACRVFGDSNHQTVAGTACGAALAAILI